MARAAAPFGAAHCRRYGGEQRTTLYGKDIARSSVDGDLICDRNTICPFLTPEPSAASKASVKPGHRVLPANDTGYLITLLIGQVPQLGR